ncbi:hypothetical protein [Nocardia bovistercoris]|uniref:Uncharacterized protein n=1 Tax=Nocardia bovistercoris TaxID=2785916 RepID=A0A931N3B4_9NOCA|nr:hypothetical protein [Nocardia bovistercoris]MBH0780440.1 hypothetical protein [Nocardia bovistercoris]
MPHQERGRGVAAMSQRANSDHLANAAASSDARQARVGHGDKGSARVRGMLDST